MVLFVSYLVQGLWISLHLERQVSKCPTFLGNFTPKTSNYWLKIGHLAFQVVCLHYDDFLKVYLT